MAFEVFSSFAEFLGEAAYLIRCIVFRSFPYQRLNCRSGNSQSLRHSWLAHA